MIDKDLLKVILQRLSEAYPNSLGNWKLAFNDYDEKKLLTHFQYLRGHNLVSANELRHSGGLRLGPLRITEKGLDYISHDGGLTAELNLVTIKVHEDTIKQLLLNAVDVSPEDQSIKELIKAKIKSETAETLSQLLIDGLKTGLAQMPNAALWLRIQLGL